MKKITLASLVLLTIFIGCKKNTTTELQVTDKVEAIMQRSCAANDVLQRQLIEDPTLKTRMDEIETFTRKTIAAGEINRLVNGVIEIPVVVNVLYRTAAENISDAQIQSQIDVLNADYNSTNSDVRKVPAIYTSSIGKVGVRFVLVLPIVRKQTNVVSWGTNDAMKRSSKGGIDPTDPAHNLNMWACNLGQGLLGYAQFPGGNSATDGVVILYSAFGSRAIYHQGTYVQDYDLGRTASHEVGHWMNLYHIWGDDGGSCNGSDRVDDTPNQGNMNFGCPAFPHVSCSNSGDMSMNYMDYTDDACMYMFTNGQAKRMLAVFDPKGPRAAIGKP
ncbi:MAG: Pregnancy-associated plasma protein-A [Chitinophagaceae bacterium]|nr:Pregnancy-associated plasma protein-A [Chitinophagaceae bacterium]